MKKITIFYSSLNKTKIKNLKTQIPKGDIKCKCEKKTWDKTWTRIVYHEMSKNNFRERKNNMREKQEEYERKARRT